MSNINGKTKALLEHKEKILEEIQYCDKSIEDFCSNYKTNRYHDVSDSSDSEDFFPDAVEAGPEVSQLKLQHRMFTTCLQATQELTGLTVLQSEVNILVQEPQLKSERPITDPGIWREVLSECKIDLVTFTITFFTHTANRKFSPILYRGLQIQLVKACHEVELNESVLHTLKRPSDAVEVIRSYAAAYRSRRTTLAHLANKYANTLFMEPHPEGGFVLKCANLLEILWRLENKWSSVAPFHHRMKFDVEYMDEAYIKIITQAHKQLLDPSIQTDERTLLLSKIIATCLQARGPVDSESDLESIGVKSRQTETQPESEPKDNEVMAPPKSLPKKSKNSASKDKDVSNNKNTAKKRTVEDDKDERNAKKAKATEDVVKKNVMTKEKSGNPKTANKENNDENKIDKPTKTVQSNDNKKSLKSKENNELKKSNNKKNNKESVTNDELKKNGNEKGSAKKRPTEKENNIDDDNTNVKPVQNLPKKKKKEKEVDIETLNVEQSKTDDHNEGINVDNAIQTKKVKSSVNNNKNDKQINNFDEESNKPKEDELDTNINIEKQNKNDIPTKKINKKTKMAVTNDKKFDVVTKKKSNNENKNNNPKINNKETVKNDASDNITKSTDKNIITNTKDVEHQKTKNNKNNNPKINNKETVKNYASDNITKSIDKNIITNTKDVEHQKTKNNKNNNPKINNKETVKNDASDNITKSTDKNVITNTKDVEHQKTKNNKNNNPKINNKETVKNDASYVTKSTDKTIITNTKDVEHQKTKNNEKKSHINNKTQPARKSTETAKNKTVKTFIERNANVLKNKDKVASINKGQQNNIKDKQTESKKDVMASNNRNRLSKLTTKTVRNIIHKSPAHKNPLKLQNSQKTFNTKTFSENTKTIPGNTEKENGGIVSKIPQKKLSNDSQTKFKKNFLRISPRKLSSKFKTISQDSLKHTMKITNIPRLMKKPVPKMSR